MSMPLSNATISTPIPVARISNGPHVFSTPCEAAAANGGPAAHECRAKEASDATSAAALRATHAAFTPDSASKFGCGRFRQEEHLLERCAEEIVRLGRRPLFVCDGTSRAIAYDKVAASLAAEGIVPRVYVHGGFCCFDEALGRAADGTLDGIDVVLGCGGGVVIDFAKCLADIASMPIVTMPTSSATCCAFTPIAPCYTRGGQYVATALFRREVAAALLDMTILSRQPARLLLAGVCDAMAKKIEIEFWNSLPGSKGNAVATGIAELVSNRIYDVLDREADAAVADLARGEPTRTLAEVVFASVVGAGIVSGISGGERQTALAHRFYFFSRLRWPEKATRRTHGELVAIGLVMQLAYYGRIQEAHAFAERLRRWGLPASVADLGVPFDPADAEACADYLAGTSEMRAAGPDALPRLRKSLEAVFAPPNL